MQKKFSDKHGKDTVLNECIRDEILKAAQDNRLSCVIAFQIAEKLGVLPSELGKTLDLMDFRLNQCQMGLFGYSPDKKIVKAEEPAPEIREAILSASEDGRISCNTAWDIAARFNIPKITVSNACEGMKIRIKPCQLGAF
ncbi:MAG TPA: hypothetical protein DCQ37_20680 [Desulfobacteraceae bacterium]|nr:hypothetical protein [Desulfobacteraceae bacterium]